MLDHNGMGLAKSLFGLAAGFALSGELVLEQSNYSVSGAVHAAISGRVMKDSRYP
jgi:hypothetical protein